MDDVMRDPELSSEVMDFSLKLLTRKLQDARRALNEEQRLSSVLRVEALQYRDLVTKQAEGRELNILSNTIKENARLKRELDELRRNSDLANPKASPDGEAVNDGVSRQTIKHLEDQVQRLENELTLEHAEAVRARQELHNVNEAFGQCKARVQELEKDMHDLQVQPTVEVPSVPPVRHKGLEIETLPVNFKEAVEIILSRPCFATGTDILDRFPPDLRRYWYGSPFYFPERTAYPVQKMMARVFAPQTEYAVINGKLTAGQPKNELHVYINTVHELFVDTPSGICYVGTYRASKVIEMSKDLYIKLDKGPREAIVKRSLATEGHWTNLDQAMQSRLRNLYMQGFAKAEYLVLHFIGFNYAMFGALMALKDGTNGEKVDSSSDATLVSPPSAWSTPPTPKIDSSSQNGAEKIDADSQSRAPWAAVRPSSSASTTKNNTPKGTQKKADGQPLQFYVDPELASEWGPSDWS